METHCLLLSFDHFVSSVRLKRRLPVIPQVRNGGVCIALAGNFPKGGDTYYSSRCFLDCFYRLDSLPGVGEIQWQKEVSRLLQQMTHRVLG